MFGQVKLKKNAWHVKLHRLVFGESAPGLKFNNFCPYFWLTIFCLIVSPFVGIVKGTIGLKDWVIDNFDSLTIWFDGFSDKHICQPMFKRYVSKMSPEDLVQGASYPGSSSNKYYKKWKAFEEWKRLTPHWKELIDAYKAEQEELSKQYMKEHDERMAANRAKEIKRKAMAMKLASITQKVAPVFIGVLIIAVVGLLGLGLYKLVLWSLTWPWAKIGMITAGIICLSIVVAIIIFIIKWAKESGDKCLIPLKWILKPILFCLKPFKIITTPLGKLCGFLFNKAGGFFSFLGEYIKATKSNHCPMIQWEE